MTPLLLEPVGPRQGVSGRGRGLRLLIAGDSAAAGVGVASQASALSGCLVRELAAEFHVTWSLVAQSGFTTSDLLERLRNEPAKPFDVVILSLGVNDITRGLRLKQWIERQRELLEMLVWRFGACRVLVTPVPSMHRIRALPQPLRWCLGKRSMRFNYALRDLARSIPECTVLHLDQKERMDSLAMDGFHPSARTYADWARVLVSEIQQGLETNALRSRSLPDGCHIA
ncbi:SGNH/GDSL hydrolase family protein [Variovorax sp. V35]